MKQFTTNSFHQKRLRESLRVGMISLGCVRNTVDSETILGHVSAQGYQLTEAQQADVVIVNTCGFIESAKKESIAVISDLAELKKEGKIKKIVVAGCLAQRYAEDLRRGFPEVDAFVGVQSLKREGRQAAGSLTGPYMSYLKICESCFNHCSFCAIPLIKGKFASRSKEAVMADVRRMDEQGIRELNIVGQDVTAYGLDLYKKKTLAGLLENIAAEVQHIGWIRLLYTYPAHITDELLEVVAREPKICKYLDMPLQHISDKILQRMNRKMTRRQTEQLIEKVRSRVPGISLRTTFIVGFPGETQKEFKELLRFMKDYPFERVGAFTYSREEDTKAFSFGDTVSVRVKESRYRALMELQEGIASELQNRQVGRVLKVLVEEAEKDGLYIGRSEYDAPDVDGNVRIKSGRKLSVGQFADVRITGADGYDLEGVCEPA